MAKIEAVIFDMDGVLVDSEKFICQAAMEMFAERGVAVRPEDFEPFVGMGENRYIGGVAEKYGCRDDIDEMKRRTYDIYLEIIRGNLKPLPGVFEFVDRCRLAGLRLAVASSADERKVRGNLAEIGLPPETFGAVVWGEAVERKKPFPDIFLLAADRLGVEPGRCMVIEDAVSGVKAAKAAGAICTAVTNTVDAEQLGEADYVVNSLGEIEL